MTIVIAFPCALALATPKAVMVACEVATGLVARFRGGAVAVEAMSRVNTVVFDKTGTLTMGRLEVVDVLVRELGTKRVEQVGFILSDLVLLVEGQSHNLLVSSICKYIKPSSTYWLTSEVDTTI